VVEWVKTGDGAELRTARWKPAGAPAGTVVLLHGRTEFIEKYCEVAGELLARGYCVFTFDWRGQGLSHRALSDPLKGHVQDFGQFDQDLHLFMDRIVLASAPEPLIGLAHSMGGNIFLRYLHDNPGAFHKAVLTAPMLAIKTSPFPQWFARAIAFLQTSLGASDGYVWGGGPQHWTHPFAGNAVTTDAARFARAEALLQAEPRLRLASPTFQWLEAAFRSMALARSHDFAQSIETPVLLMGAAHDQIVHPGADMRLIRRLKHGSFVLLQAQHEIMMERDEIRNLFWGFFDAFVAAK
jgi:lysophospholipase